MPTIYSEGYSAIWEMWAEIERRLAQMLNVASFQLTGWGFGGFVGWIGGQETHVPATEWSEKKLGKKAGKALKNPLAPLLRAWQKTNPVLTDPNRRSSGRIIPSQLAQVDPSDSRGGRLFSVAAHVGEREQLVLPGFGRAVKATPALPLELWDLGADTTAPTSQAAPLALRLFVSAILAVPLDRRNGHPVAMDVPLRELLRWIYPGPRTPRPNEYSPRLATARESLFKTLIPLIDSKTGRGQLRQIVNMGAVPRGPDMLDDVIRFVVDLPVGSGVGPQVSAHLNWWGARSAVKFRLLLNLPYQWFEPGRTHFPVGRGESRHWLQKEDPSLYPFLSDAELVDLAFPKSAKKNRRELALRARKDLQELADADELRIIEGHILPPATGPKQ